jgi:small GTP-binding protein
MQTKKLAIIGSVGSGKSTLIKNLSQTTALDTDVESTVDIGKLSTTVGVDYGMIDVDESLKLGIYGVPGQRKFSFVWDFVKEGLWAVVILVKNNAKESVEELDYLLDYFEVDETVPCLIGITHSDLIKGDQTKSKIKTILQKRGLTLPIYSINATLKDNAELIIRTLILLEETNNGT